jgi:hypothetical protein
VSSPWAGTAYNAFTGQTEILLGKAWLFTGDASGGTTWSDESDAIATISGESHYEYFGHDPGYADLDNDGHSDLAFTFRYGSGNAFRLYYGPIAGSLTSNISDADAWGVMGSTVVGNREGVPDGPFDTNLDGYEELWVGNYLFYGAP